MKFLVPLIAVAALAACDASEVTLDPARGQTVQQAVNAQAFTRGTALTIALICDKQGVSMKDDDLFGAISRDTDALVARGYSREAVRKAQKNLPKKALARKTTDWLKARGATDADRNSVCKVGRPAGVADDNLKGN